MSNRVKWNIEADYLQACSCDYGCPCEFNAPPSRGFCHGMGAWRINKGSYGNVRLDGLGLGFAASWPKAMHQGGGIAVLFVDEKANPEQRDALLQIASGKAGGKPFEIIVTTFSKILEPQFVPIKFKINGREGSFQLGNSAEASLTPILNPVTKEPEAVAVEHTTGFIFQRAEVVAADKMRVSASGLEFSWPDKAGFVDRVKYNN